MKEITHVVVIVVALFVNSALCMPMTQIQYETTEIASGRWQYTYDVINISLSEPIKEFTVWFDYGLYENLTIMTPDPPATDWDEVLWQPEPGFGDGGYDALTLDLGIGEGERIKGFCVSFDWLGVGKPGTQFYEIIDPVDFTTTDSGFTVPEPGTIALIGLGSLFLLRKTKNKSKQNAI